MVSKETCELYCQSMPKPWVWIFLEYYDYLLIRPSRRGGLLRVKTIYALITCPGGIIRELLDASKNLDEITIEKLLTHFKDQKQKKMVVNRYIEFLEFCYKRKENLVTKKYIEEVKKLKLKNQKKKVNSYLHPEEIYKWSVPKKRYIEIFKQVSEYPAKFAIWIGLEFGLRSGEILQLQLENFIWEKSDSAEGFLTIETKELEDDLVWEPKTDQGIRRLPIQIDQKKQILAYFKKREKYLEVYFNHKDTAKKIERHTYVIFSMRTKRKIVYDTLRYWLGKITLQFTEQGKTFTRNLRGHVLRYSFAINFYNETRNIFMTSKMLGHATLVQSEQYLALTEDQVYQELAKVTRSIREKDQDQMNIQDIYVEQVRKVHDLRILATIKEYKENTVFMNALEKLEVLTKKLLKMIE